MMSTKSRNFNIQGCYVLIALLLYDDDDDLRNEEWILFKTIINESYSIKTRIYPIVSSSKIIKLYPILMSTAIMMIVH
jgi:hypothetical protein